MYIYVEGINVWMHSLSRLGPVRFEIGTDVISTGEVEVRVRVRDVVRVCVVAARQRYLDVLQQVGFSQVVDDVVVVDIDGDVPQKFMIRRRSTTRINNRKTDAVRVRVETLCNKKAIAYM